MPESESKPPILDYRTPDPPAELHRLPLEPTSGEVRVSDSGCLVAIASVAAGVLVGWIMSWFVSSPWPVVLAAGVVVYLLVRWGRQFETVVKRSGIVDVIWWFSTWALLCVLFLPAYHLCIDHFWGLRAASNWSRPGGIVVLAGDVILMIAAGWIAWRDRK